MSSFHYDFILSERSTLAKVWLAAHWEKKLSKVQVFETNLLTSVHDILHPITPIALRTSSHLLVGLVRIYSRKAKYLLIDCSEAMVNIKVAFRPGAQILEESKKKKRSQVDCPLFITEKVDLLDQWVPEVSNVEMDCSLNQSKIEEITIQEEPMKVSSFEDYFDDEGFGDMFDSELTEQEKGESSFSRVHSFADSDCVLEDGFSYSSSITDFNDPFLSLTPVKEADEINKHKNSTVETQSEIDILKCISELDEEMPDVRNLPEGNPVKLHIEMRNNHGNEQAKIVLEPIVETVKPPKKSLKRKLLIDSVISIDREEYFYQIKNASRLCGMPVMAPRTKYHMKQIRKDAQSLFLSQSHHEFLAPCLQKLFECHKVKNNLISSSLVEEQITFNHIDENGGENIDSVFIPIEDVEYSGDENDVTIFDNEDQKSFPDETNSASSVEDDASTEQDEDITHDEFCAFVETTVLKSHPEPINIQQVILQGSPSRKNVARRFIKCLIMQRDGRLRLDQASHFSGIYLYPGNNHVSLLDCS